MTKKVVNLYEKQAPGDCKAWTMEQCLEYALKELRENPEMSDYRGGMVMFYRQNKTGGFSHRALTSNLTVAESLALLHTEAHATMAGY